MDDELERVLKNMIVAQSKYYPGICLEGLKRTMKASVKKAAVPAGI
jgi:hypothetical protein